jgi:ubiquinone/menaquinone biosynthesis C-methylase UbiE
LDSTRRFSDRVANYVKYRPSYPDAMIEYLVSKVQTSEYKILADIGSGTGILTRLLLSYYEKVIGVEPNNEMRLEAERALGSNERFVSVSGTAESTTLLDKSVNIITVAQAFHWFDREKTKKEFGRILKENGLVALIWNNRLVNTEFLREYDSVLKEYATDYNEVNHQNIKLEDLQAFYGGEVEKKEFKNKQEFDLESVYGRLDSSSYAPKPGTENYRVIREKLKDAFDLNELEGKVSFNYLTEMYIGELK